MKLASTLIWFIFVSSVSFGYQADSVELRFQSCSKQALRKKTPPDRDNAKFICLGKFKGISLSQCLKEAGKMEYLLNSQEALKSCYYSRPQLWNVKRCLDVAKMLHTSIDRDNMRLDCVSQIELQQISQDNCLKVSQSFEQLHYKERFKQACQEK